MIVDWLEYRECLTKKSELNQPTMFNLRISHAPAPLWLSSLIHQYTKYFGLFYGNHLFCHMKDINYSQQHVNRAFLIKSHPFDDTKPHSKLYGCHLLWCLNSTIESVRAFGLSTNKQQWMNLHLSTSHVR